MTLCQIGCSCRVLITEIAPLMIGHFAWEMKDSFYYFAVKSAVAAFAKDFRFEVVVRFFGGNKSSIAVGWHKSLVNGSEMLTDGIVEDATVDLIAAE